MLNLDCQKVIFALLFKGNMNTLGRTLTPGEIGALLNTCAGDETAASARYAVGIALLYGAGLKAQRGGGTRLGSL